MVAKTALPIVTSALMITAGDRSVPSFTATERHTSSKLRIVATTTSPNQAGMSTRGRQPSSDSLPGGHEAAATTAARNDTWNAAGRWFQSAAEARREPTRSTDA